MVWSLNKKFTNFKNFILFYFSHKSIRYEKVNVKQWQNKCEKLLNNVVIIYGILLLKF